MKPSVTLFIPTKNEIEAMRVVMPQIDRAGLDQILVVDDSTDGTAEYAESIGCDVVRQQGKGLRAAYVEGIAQVRGDLVVTFSPDGNSPVEAIPRLIAKIQEGYDMVIGSRYLPPAKSEDDDPLTAFGNWLFTHAINVLHGHAWSRPYTDAMVIYRIYPTRLFRELDLGDPAGYVTEKAFGTLLGVEPLLSVRAAKRKLRIAEIPVDEPARIGGARKLQPFRWGGAYLAQIVRELWFWK